MNSDISGQIAVVTGGSSGIGRAVVDRFTRAGAIVTNFDREAPDGAPIPNVTHVEVDVTDQAAVTAAVDAVAEANGRIDVLVACAGGGSGDVLDNRGSDLTIEVLEASFRLNVVGTVTACVAVSAHMKAAGRGVILTVGSINGLETTETGGYSHYGTSKAAQLMYTRYLAQDLAAYGITVNAIAPGPISTPRLVAKYAQSGLDQAAAIPLGRAGTPEELAETIAFLVSGATPYLTGAVIPVHGGMMRSY